MDEIKPAANSSPIYVSKNDLDSIDYLNSEIQNQDRYQTIIVRGLGGPNHSLPGEFGCIILCADCNNSRCITMQPSGYRFLKYVECSKCGHTYYNK